jgi:hypothetical protein
MLPADVFNIVKGILTISLAKLRWKTEKMNTREMFICEDRYYIINSLWKNVLKIATTKPSVELNFYKFFLLSVFLLHMLYRKTCS